MQSVTDVDGSCIFADAPQIQKHTAEKAGQALFAVTVRVGCKSHHAHGAGLMAQRMASALGQYDRPGQNRLLPLVNDYYPDAVHEEDLLSRLTHRTGMLLSLAELVGLVHLPSQQVHSRQLIRQVAKTKACPSSVIGHALVLGDNLHQGVNQSVSLSEAQRMRHAYVIGSSGTGKSTLLRNMMLQDIQHGEGVALLDPHGDLVDSVLARIPAARQQDVMVLDAGDAAYPIGFNILHAHSDAEKTMLAEDLTNTFKRLSDSWGDRMHAVLANGMLAMLAHPEGGTLLTLRRFLTDKGFREQFLAQVDDAEIRYFWERTYPLYTGRPESSVITRLDTFLRPKTIRNMVAQAKRQLDIASAMDNRKILLVKLSHGAIGEDNAHLLGSLIVTAIHQAALRRQSQAVNRRIPFYLYIDEFHHFVTPSMAGILSGTRKYLLGLTLAHQERRQLVSLDREVASSVLANAYSQIYFRLGHEDASALAKGLAYFEGDDLQNLGIGQAIMRSEQAQHDFNLQVHEASADWPETHASTAMIDQSRALYGKPQSVVEAEVAALYPKAKQGAADSEAVTDKPVKTEKVPGQVDAIADIGASAGVGTAAAVAALGKGVDDETDNTADDKPQHQSTEKKAVVDVEKDTVSTGDVGLGEDDGSRGEETVAAQEEAGLTTKQLGRGGTQHSYLQNLIKKYAEERGFKAVIEAPVLGGSGFVDVSLEIGSEKIACEISVSTEVQYEVQNIQKCLAAGYGQVVLVSNSEAKLKLLQTKIRDVLETDSIQKVHCLEPEAFLAYLDTLVANQVKAEKTVRGYKVKSQFKQTTKAERDAKSLAVARLIAKGLK